VLPTERVGAVIDAPVSTIAFRDTLMDLAGLDLAGVDAGRESLGRTVLDGAHPARRFLFLHTDFEPPLPNSEEKRSHVWGVVDAEQRLKWTVDHNPGEDQPPRLALYDVDADPLEEHNLLEQSDQARALESFKKTRELWLFQGLLPEPLKRRDPTRPHAPPPGGR
jgi:arylsulfatase A-like enzyme